jgi:hypothetical protein
MNYIKNKVTKKLISEIKKRQTSFTHNGFFFFNEPIIVDDLILDRVSDWAIYEYDKILPKKFSIVSGKILFFALKKILNDEFYIFKTINGKSYRIKTKKDETFKEII